MHVMHARALQPALEPTRVAARDVVVAKIPIERKQEGKYPEVHHGDFGNGSAHQPNSPCAASIVPLSTKGAINPIPSANHTGISARSKR
jgi:hypothetical protein